MNGRWLGYYYLIMRLHAKCMTKIKAILIEISIVFCIGASISLQFYESVSDKVSKSKYQSCEMAIKVNDM